MTESGSGVDFKDLMRRAEALVAEIQQQKKTLKGRIQRLEKVSAYLKSRQNAKRAMTV